MLHSATTRGSKVLNPNCCSPLPSPPRCERCELAAEWRCVRNNGNRAHSYRSAGQRLSVMNIYSDINTRWDWRGIASATSVHGPVIWSALRAPCCDWPRTSVTREMTSTWRNVVQSYCLRPGRLPSPELPSTQRVDLQAASPNTPAI